MTKEDMIAAEDLVLHLFGQHAELEIEDDGSGFITIGDEIAVEAFFAFHSQRPEVTRLTLTFE